MADAAAGLTSVTQLKSADQLSSKVKELEELRNTDKREWAQNRAFYRGDQWILWNRTSQQVESLPTQDGDKPRWKVRLTSNQIMSGVNHYVALLLKTKPIVSAVPDSGLYRDVCAAQVAQDLYDHLWRELSLGMKLHGSLTDACLSEGWWKVEWDPYAGKSMQVVLDPNGQPITDKIFADMYLDEIRQVAQQQGQDPEAAVQQVVKTIYVGDLKITTMPGESVYLDPSAEHYTDAKWAICRHAMDVDEIYTRWKIRVEPDAAPADSTPLMFQKKKDEKAATLKNVYIGYFKPTPIMPKGRYVVWIEEPNQILEDKPWNYPFNELPLVKWPGVYRPGSAHDEPIVTQARPLQKELNRTLSQIVQYKDLTIKPQMMAPIGSLRQRMTDEPGAIFEYQPIQGLSPEWRQTPAMNSSGLQILEDIQNRINLLFNRMPAQRDSLPARIDAGYGIEMIQEAVADQLSPVIQRIEDGLARAGKLMALLAKQYYDEPRMLMIKGDGGGTKVRKFMNSDLDGGFSFHAEAGSGLPRSRAGREARIMDMMDKGMLTPQQGMKYLDLADMRGIKSQMMADEDQAYREHDKLINGLPLNPMAMRDAEQQAPQMVQQAMQPDPNTGQPPDPQQIMQQIQKAISDASLAPLDFEDFDTHLQVHGLFMKSPEFEQLDPEVQTRFTTHWNQTLQKSIAIKKASLTLDPKVQPKTSFNFRATTSAPVAAKVLEAQGVDTTPEEVAMPPLDTAVIDFMEKANLDDSGNSHHDDTAKLIEMQQAEDQHALAVEQTQREHALSTTKSVMDLQRQQQQMDHEAMMQEHDRRNAALTAQQQQEQHQVRIKVAQRPKGNGGNQ